MSDIPTIADRMPLSAAAREAEGVYATADKLYGQAEVEEVLDELAAAITEQLSDKEPLILCLMIGGIVVAGHLLTRLQFPLQVDYIHATRYRGATQGGALHWIARPSCPLQGRTVLIVDDILDEGVTLGKIMDDCRSSGAVDVRAAVLVNKQRRRLVDVAVEFTGLTVPDRYVFGYGMDYKGFLRNVPGIYAVADS